MKRLEEIEKNAHNPEIFKNCKNGRNQMKLKNYSAAKIIFDNLLKTNFSFDNSIKMDVLLLLSFTNFYLSLYKESQISFIKALEICQSNINDFNGERAYFMK